MKKAIVFASVYYKSDIKVGSHHYADALSRNGYKVLYISHPVSVFHYVAALFDARHVSRLFSLKGRDAETLVEYHIPFTPFPLLNIFPLNSKILLMQWHIFSLVWIRIKLFLGDDNCDVIWCENGYYYKVFEKLKRSKNTSKLIFRLADNVYKFKNFPPCYREILEHCFTIADKIIISAQSLKKIVPPSNWNKVIHLPNAVNIFKYARCDLSQPVEYVGDLGKRIVYIGAIEYWFNWDLVRKIAVSNPGATVYIIGPIKNSSVPKSVSEVQNLKILGPRNNGKIGMYLANADVGIIPFLRDDLIDCVDPIKYYEYSFFGIPTVCSYWEEVSYIKSQIYLAHSDEEFIVMVSSLLRESREKFPKTFFGIDFTIRNWDHNVKRLL